MPHVEGGGAADLLKEDLLAPCRLEVIHLRVSGLMRGGAPRVTDFSTHCSARHCLTRTPYRKATELSFRTLYEVRSGHLHENQGCWRNQRVSEQQKGIQERPDHPVLPYLRWTRKKTRTSTHQRNSVKKASHPNPAKKNLRRRWTNRERETKTSIGIHIQAGKGIVNIRNALKTKSRSYFRKKRTQGVDLGTI